MLSRVSLLIAQTKSENQRNSYLSMAIRDTGVIAYQQMSAERKWKRGHRWVVDPCWDIA